MGKAQITIFIILGIVLLLSVGIVVYFVQTRERAELEKAVVVPEDVRQVYDFVSECVNQVSKEGIILMGEQGGYLYLPGIIERTPTAYVQSDPFGVVKTPFWYLDGEDRTPSLDGMQRDLALWVKQGLTDCVDNFAAFTGAFQVAPKGDIVPVIGITDEEVLVQVNWPLEVSTKERTTDIKEFFARHDVRLKKSHDLASKVMKYENKEAWFENLTIDLMSMNPRTPISGMEFFCGTKKWFLPEVKRELQQMLYYNLPNIRVANAFAPPPLASERTYEKLKDEAAKIRSSLEAGKEPKFPKNVPDDVFEVNRMTLDVGAEESDLRPAFIYYPDWNLLMNAQPSRGGMLSTANMKGPKKYLRFVCLNQWHFAYDLIYPVKFTVRDDTAFNGDGFVFSMAFPVIVQDNAPSRVFFGLRKFVVPPTAVDFCTNFGSRAVDVRARGFIEGSPIAEELEDVNITYRCVNQECVLGRTLSDGSGAIRFVSYLPEGCSSPVIIGQKDGYLPAELQATGDRVDLELTKLKKMQYSIMIHPYYEEVARDNPLVARQQRWLEGQTYSKFTKTMHATVYLTERKSGFEQYLIYPASGQQFTSEKVSGIPEYLSDEVSFVYGDAAYDIDVMLFKGDTVVGGYHAENISVSFDDLATANNVILHVVEYRPLPEQPHQQAGMFLFLQERGTYEDKPYWKVLKPTFT
ncbi:hypothetical protein HY489_00850 [Candidatus Woesearchaeota archaeon]|nr:hypothetical protein [Candidatus Woesearchaeota archaeon]